MPWGQDYRKRIAQLIRNASSSAKPHPFTEATNRYGDDKLIFFAHLSAARLLEQGLRVAQTIKQVPGQVIAMAQGVMPAGKQAPIDVWWRAENNRTTMDTSISSDAIGMVVRGIVAGLMSAAGGSP